MLSQEENRKLTQVGPGTPGGALLRRYWHPIAAALELEESPTKEVRVLGEDLVLYRDRSGKYGLIDRYCAHRRVNLAYGIPEDHGLRCMYHGWAYDETGQCVEQPFEETVRPEGRFKDKIRLKGYPVQELSGVIFAYLGPEPAPQLPRWQPLVMDNVVREITITVLPCNWLQCMENSMDPVHVEWLHVNYTHYLKQRRGQADNPFPRIARHQKIGFDTFQYGIVKRRVVEGQTEQDDDWKVGHPVIFPNLLYVAGAGVQVTFQYRTPIDDTHSLHFVVWNWMPAPGKQAPKQDRVPYRYSPLYDETGMITRDYVLDQDKLAWVIQGPVVDRSLEHLGESDRGVILFRKVLLEQMRIMEDGGDPMGVVRGTEEDALIPLPVEAVPFGTKVPRYIPGEGGESPARALIEATLATYGAEEPAAR